jgi:hypothetical protein
VLVIEDAIEIVDNATGKRPASLFRWRCRCGANTGGRWYRSEEEALKAARRHLEDHEPDA